MQVEYQNSTALLAVIGDPIAHSLSPLLQNTMLKALGEDYLYLAIPVKGGEVGKFVEAAKEIGIRGFNLTMPHKEDILPYLASMTPEAEKCRSVNSVRIRQGRLEGHSTDGVGFRRALQDLGVSYDGRIVTILGAGGAAKSIAMTAVMSGARQVNVVNRTISKAEKLCEGMETMAAYSLSEAGEVLPRTDILVSTLPTGMEGVGGGFDAVDLGLLKKEAVCADCIYAPAMTPFMAEAMKHGHRAINGIGMLVYQAVYALEFFLDRSLPEETVTVLGKKLLEVSGVDPFGKA